MKSGSRRVSRFDGQSKCSLAKNKERTIIADEKRDTKIAAEEEEKTEN